MKVSSRFYCAALSIALISALGYAATSVESKQNVQITIETKGGAVLKFPEGQFSLADIETGSKVSLVDLSGKVIIPANYETINYHGDGFYRCETSHDRKKTKIPGEKAIEGKDFFVFDRDGKKSSLAAYLKARLNEKKIEGSFARQHSDSITEFYDGLAPFRAESKDPKDKVTYMTIYSGKQGKNVEKVPIADEHAMRWGYINEAKKTIIPNKFVEAHPFSEGVAVVRVSHPTDRSVYQFINTKGAKVSPEFAAANDFVDGYAVVAVYDDKLKVEKVGADGLPKSYGIIDKTFRFVVKPQYSTLKMLKPNLLFAAPFSGSNSSLIDRKGAKIATLPQRFESITTHQNSDTQWIFSIKNYGKTPEEKKAYVINSKGQVLKVYDDTRQAFDQHNDFHHFGFQAEETDWNNGRTLEFKDKNGAVKKVSCNGVETMANSSGLTVIIVNDKKIPFKFRRKYHPLQGVIGLNGETVIKPERASFRVTESDRIIKTTYKEHFDSNDCKQFAALGRNLSYLLQDYNLIGMSKKQLEDLVGPGQISKKDGTSVYPLAQMHRSSYGQYDYAQFKYENDKLKSWKLIPSPNYVPLKIISASGFNYGPDKPEKPMDWITTNVVSDYWNPTEFRPKK